MCNACYYITNGFTYRCDVCNFDLDVPCSLLSDMLTHVGHEHPLILSSTTNAEECSACNSKGKIFRCTKCEFTLDFGCATLPHTVGYKQHEHPFTLRYTAEDDSGEYYCDICEEERDPKLWFYYCEECSYPAIPNVFLNGYYQYLSLETYEMLSLGAHTHPQSTNISSLLFIRLRTSLLVTNVVALAMNCSLNVPRVISVFTVGVCNKCESDIIGI
jgi:hypothetical protein